MIHLNFLQVMDSQIDSELLDSMLEKDIILLSSEETDTDLLGSDLDLNLHDIDTTKPYSILDELMACPPTHNTKHQYSTNTTTSTTSSTICFPLSTMTTITTHSTINTTNRIPARNYSNTQHNTTPTHTPITTKTKKFLTTHILKKLRHQTTATTLSTSTTPPHTSYNIYPLPINPNPPSRTISKCKNTPSNPQSETLAIHLLLYP